MNLRLYFLSARMSLPIFRTLFFPCNILTELELHLYIHFGEFEKSLPRIRWTYNQKGKSWEVLWAPETIGGFLTCVLHFLLLSNFEIQTCFLNDTEPSFKPVGKKITSSRLQIFQVYQRGDLTCLVSHKEGLMLDAPAASQGALLSGDLTEASLQQYDTDRHIPSAQVQLVVEYKAAEIEAPLIIEPHMLKTCKLSFMWLGKSSQIKTANRDVNRGDKDV